MADEFTPNQFELTGKGDVRITYIPGGEGPLTTEGPLKLEYHDAQHGDLSFRGDAVRTQDTDVGKLVTVTLRQTVDQGNVLFTLILPTGFTKQGPEDKIHFHTEGIVTTQHVAVDNPTVKGPNLTYQYVALQGTAENVVLPL